MYVYIVCMNWVNDLHGDDWGTIFEQSPVLLIH